jgi:hypothetical protein
MAKTTETSGSLAEILKSAAELLKSDKGGLAHALGVASLGPAFAAAAGLAGMARVIAKMLDDRAKARPADEAGKAAITAAFVAAAADAVRITGRPDTSTPFDQSIDVDHAAFPDYYGTLAGFDAQRPSAHAWYRFAVRSLDDLLVAQAYSDRERRLIANKTEELSIEVWQSLKADPGARDTLERFEKWAKETPPSYLDTILVHIEHQRWTFREKPLLGKEHFSLADVYLQTDCVEYTGDAVKSRGRRPANTRRVGLRETVVRLLRARDFVDMILIEAPPGYGKSAFTLYLTDYLYGHGLLPLRIRIRDLASIDKQGIWEALESRIAWRPAEEQSNPIFRGFTRNKAPFDGGSIFSTSCDYGEAEICPYVLILDGWDEVAAGSGAEYRDRLRTLLLEIRRIFIDRQDERTSGAAQIRVILTGRSGDDLLPDEVLTRGVRVLSLQPFTSDQLKEFFATLKAAVERPRPPRVVPAPTDWPLQPRWEQMKHVADLYDPDERDSVLGYPLLAHLSFWIYAKRLQTDSNSDASSLLSDTTSLYRQLVDLTCAEAGKASFEQWNTATREKHKASGAYLRDLIRRTAAAAYCSGESGAISREQLLRFLPSDHRLRNTPDGLDPNPLSQLLVSYYFSSQHPERGCEFVHQSFLEYLYAEAIVEWVKALPTGTFPVPATKSRVDAPLATDALLWLFRCFSMHDLGDQVLKHLLRLMLWEIERARNSEVAQGDPTEPVSLDSWRHSMNVVYSMIAAVAYGRFFDPVEDGSPSLYHFLSSRPGTLAKIDSDLAAGFLNTAGILGYSLFPEHGRPRLSALGDSDVLQRAFGQQRRIFLRSWDLSLAGLTRFRILKADLRGADLKSAYLYQTYLEADCRDANLSGAILERSHLRGNFSSVDFRGAELQHALLYECFLMDADFSGADLEGANLRATSIQGADFLTAKNLTQKQIDRAFGDDTTKLPEGIHRPSTWPYERPTPIDWETDK